MSEWLEAPTQSGSAAFKSSLIVNIGEGRLQNEPKDHLQGRLICIQSTGKPPCQLGLLRSLHVHPVCRVFD